MGRQGKKRFYLMRKKVESSGEEFGIMQKSIINRQNGYNKSRKLRHIQNKRTCIFLRIK